METFSEPREFIDDPVYQKRRTHTVSTLGPGSIDTPIRDLILGFAALPYCFTLQSCHGHFVYDGQEDPRDVGPLPKLDPGPMRYRIAYLALCLENGEHGRRLRSALEGLTAIDPEYVQFGSPEWFWAAHPNSYAIQVEPGRFMLQDETVIGHDEALRIQHVRDQLFVRLCEILVQEKAAVGLAG